MINLTNSLKVHICTTPTDMRKSFDSLAGVISNMIGKNPLSGELFVFFNKAKTMVKIMRWQKGGYSIYYKRLEQGAYHLPVFESAKIASVEFDLADLVLVLEGIELQDSKKYKRFA